MKVLVISIIENGEKKYIKHGFIGSRQLQTCSLIEACFFTDPEKTEEILKQYELPQATVEVIELNVVNSCETTTEKFKAYASILEEQDQPDKSNNQNDDRYRFPFTEELVNKSFPTALVFSSNDILSKFVYSTSFLAFSDRIWIIPETKEIFEEKIEKSFKDRNPIAFITEQDFENLDQSIKARIAFYRIKS